MSKITWFNLEIPFPVSRRYTDVLQAGLGDRVTTIMRHGLDGLDFTMVCCFSKLVQCSVL